MFYWLDHAQVYDAVRTWLPLMNELALTSPYLATTGKSQVGSSLRSRPH